MRKYNLFMEKFWMVAAIAIFGYSIFMYVYEDWTASDAFTGIIVALVTATLSYLRYYMRKRLERNQENKP